MTEEIHWNSTWSPLNNRFKTKKGQACQNIQYYLKNIKIFEIWATFSPLFIKISLFWIQIQEAFYHETVLVHRPSGTNEIIDIIDKSSKHMDPKSIFSFIPQYLVSEWLLFNAKMSKFSDISLQNKLHSMKWWWWPLWSRPTRWVGFL
jgi:hypothetical protein